MKIGIMIRTITVVVVRMVTMNQTVHSDLMFQISVRVILTQAMMKVIMMIMMILIQIWIICL